MKSLNSLYFKEGAFPLLFGTSSVRQFGILTLVVRKIKRKYCRWNIESFDDLLK